MFSVTIQHSFKSHDSVNAWTNRLCSSYQGWFSNANVGFTYVFKDEKDVSLFRLRWV